MANTQAVGSAARGAKAPFPGQDCLQGLMVHHHQRKRSSELRENTQAVVCLGAEIQS